MSNEVTKSTANALPAHLQAVRKHSIGNVDSTDMILPRLKLLQGISPEVTAYDAARSGEFWHTMADKSLGKMVRVVPIRVVRTLVLWAPRGDERGVLARSIDGINWDKPNEKFEVKLKGSPKKQVWDTGDNVKSSGLAEFGSSIAEDPNSQPAAALTYTWLFYLPDHHDIAPVMVINTRAAVKAAKQLISKIEMGAVEPFYRIYEMSMIEQKHSDGSFNNYQYTSAGYVEDPKVAEHTAMLYYQFKEANYRSNDEADESDGGAPSNNEADTTQKQNMRKKFS